MNKHHLICDTTLLLYLDRIGQTPLLRTFFEPIAVSQQVRLELDTGRLLKPDTIDASQLGWVSLVSVEQSELDALPPNRLGRGEQSVIAYARSRQGYWAGLDDYQARLLAERLGLKVVGVIGVLLRAKRAGLILAVQPHLVALQMAGFRLTEGLYRETLRLADERDS